MRTRFAAIRDAMAAAVGTVLAIVPHVMHHIGLLAGAALITGAAGNAIFYAVGLLFSLPVLRRLYRHFHSAWAPGIAVAVFTGLFSLSAFVIGPAISGVGDAQEPTKPDAPPSVGEHGHTGPTHAER